MLVGEDGRPRLSEFLLAREIFLRRDPGAADASEAASGRRTRDGCEVDDPLVVDLFALGNLLHLGLSGRPAAPSSDIHGLLALLDEERPDPFESLDPDLDAAGRKALGLDQGDRYASAGAFAQDLDRILRAEPRRATPPAHRFRLSSLLAACGVALGIAALAGWAVWAGRLREDEPALAGGDAREIERAFEELAGAGEGTSARSEDPNRAAYAEALRRILADPTPRRVILHVEAHLHQPFVAEETLRAFEEAMPSSPEAIRLAMLEMTSDAFDAVLSPLASGPEPDAARALGIVATLGLPRANRHLLLGLAARSDHDAWVARAWSAYEAINGPGPTNRLREDLAALPPADAERVVATLRQAGLWKE